MDLFRHSVGPAGSRLSPVVILHGLFGSHRNWQSVSTSLAERLQRLVVCADLRNHGKSVRFPSDSEGPIGEPMEWPLMTEDLTRLLLDIGRPVTLLGHSLGGHMAMQAVLGNDPRIHGLVSRLIIVDIAPRRMDFCQSIQYRYLQAMEQIDSLHLPRKEAMAQFRQVETDERIIQFLFTNYGKLRDGREGFLIPLSAIRRGMMTLSDTFCEYLHRTSPVKMPTLFIKGEASDYIRDADVPLIKGLFPDADLCRIPDSGHWPHHDQPVPFLDCIVQTMTGRK